jgi:hypothetical protein
VVEPIRIEVRLAVDAYLLQEWRMAWLPPEEEKCCLDRIRANPEGKATIAFDLLYPAAVRARFSPTEIYSHMGAVLADLMAAIELSRHPSEIQGIKVSFRTAAARQRKYVDEFRGKVPVELIDYAEKIAAWHEAQVQRLPDALKRTQNIPSAKDLVVIRDFRDRLRDDRGPREPPREAIRLLVETALGRPISANMVRDALDEDT